MQPLTLEDFLREEDERVAARAKEVADTLRNPKDLKEVKQKFLREQALTSFMTRDLKPAEAAEILGIHVNTMKKLLKSGQIDGYRIGTRGDWRIPREVINQYRLRGTF